MRRRSAERADLRLLNVRVGGNVPVEPGQRVGDLIPRSSILCVNVGFRATAGIAVERAERDADGFRVLAVGPEEGGAARAAELARDALRRTKGAKRALAALQTEAPSRETGVGRERRSVRLAAHAAVAVRDVAELSLDLVPYRSAEASAGQRGLHVPLLLRSSISRIAALGARGFAPHGPGDRAGSPRDSRLALRGFRRKRVASRSESSRSATARLVRDLEANGGHSGRSR